VHAGNGCSSQTRDCRPRINASTGLPLRVAVLIDYLVFWTMCSCDGTSSAKKETTSRSQEKEQRCETSPWAGLALIVFSFCVQDAATGRRGYKIFPVSKKRRNRSDRLRRDFNCGLALIRANGVMANICENSPHPGGNPNCILDGPPPTVQCLAKLADNPTD
jgi:hypothetical protein